MDVNLIRVAVMIVGLVMFLGLLAHTWSKRRQAEHEQAALLPFAGADSSFDNRGEKL
jgi:cbb3-type cytochrome oxidase subunit 3